MEKINMRQNIITIVQRAPILNSMNEAFKTTFILKLLQLSLILLKNLKIKTKVLM
jgi:hypothetical protein